MAVEIRASHVPPAAASLALADGALGRVLGGKYRVERKLGEGAMGVVLAATHVGLEEPVAIKFMRPELHGTTGTLERFAKEAKIAARIRSEHVAKVLDVGESEELGPYIVMEYLEGKSLAELLDARLFDRQGPMAAERVIEYALQACEALAAAHAVGVVHRDVKPDNLFVTRHAGVELLKLLDFGISKAAPAPAATGTASIVMGTPLYMSPEQLRSLPDVDARTDIWSLGAVMYELLSGRPPFQAASLAEICASILDSAPAPLPDACPSELRASVLRCLEKDREQRFENVAALAAALAPLAPGHARAYASRSSGILRASVLNLDLASEASASARQAPGSRGIQSSALVAAATVLALSALGVTITIARMRGSAPAASVVAPPRAEPAPIIAATPTLAERAASALVPPAPAIRQRLLADNPSAESAPSPPAPPAREPPRAPSRAASPTRPGSASNALARSALAAERRELARAARVRLVEERPRLRLVGELEPPDDRSPAGRRTIRRIGEAPERSRP